MNYVYFDKNGVLKEVINTNLVAGSSGKKIYCYWDGDDDNYTDSWIRFKRADDTYFPSITTYYEETAVVNEYIPFNENRDLKFFKYNEPYKFRVFTIPDDVLANTTNTILDVLASIFYVDENGTSEPTIDSNGVVTLPNTEEGEVIAMDYYVFGVAPSNSQMTSDENINLAQWNYLIKYIHANTGTPIDNVLQNSPNAVKSSGIYIALENLRTYVDNGFIPKTVFNTAGEIMYFNGSDIVALSPGNNGYVLKINNNTPIWTRFSYTDLDNKPNVLLKSGGVMSGSINMNGNDLYLENYITVNDVNYPRYEAEDRSPQYYAWGSVSQVYYTQSETPSVSDTVYELSGDSIIGTAYTVQAFVSKKVVEQKQADWNETNASDKGYIKNKPQVYTKTESDDKYAEKSSVYTKTEINNDFYNKSAMDTALNTKQNASSLETDVASAGFTKNAGTITGITMNGESKGTSGVVDLGTVITDKSDKVNIGSDTDSESAISYYGLKKLITNETFNKANTYVINANIDDGVHKNFLLKNRITNYEVTQFQGFAFIDINNNEVLWEDLKIGDKIYLTNTNYPDRWIGSFSKWSNITFCSFEAKTDLTSYYTKTEVDNTFEKQSELDSDVSNLGYVKGTGVASDTYDRVTVNSSGLVSSGSVREIAEHQITAQIEIASKDTTLIFKIINNSNTAFTPATLTTYFKTTNDLILGVWLDTDTLVLMPFYRLGTQIVYNNAYTGDIQSVNVSTIGDFKSSQFSDNVKIL